MSQIKRLYAYVLTSASGAFQPARFCCWPIADFRVICRERQQETTLRNAA